MAKVAKIAPDNSMVVVVGSNEFDVPQAFGASLIAATASCIAVGCKSSVDGPTQFVLGQRNEVDPGRVPNFESVLDTFLGFVSVQSVLHQTILEMRTSSNRTRISIWVNDLREPDLVILGVAEPSI
jgi:hypothetical protein